MKQTKLHKPRDPYFAEMVQRKSGVHQKSKKAVRRKEKMDLKKATDRN